MWPCVFTRVIACDEYYQFFFKLDLPKTYVLYDPISPSINVPVVGIKLQGEKFDVKNEKNE